ncbi:MAG: phospho-N-acetylmuramoyl-pentapeptide-transferase [Patescibacteria group bacterium]
MMSFIDISAVIKVLVLSTLSFVLALAWTPLLTNFLYRHKLGKQIRDSGETPIFTKFHLKKSGTPTMGGVLIWGTTLALALVINLLSRWTPFEIWDQLNFLNRAETRLPLGALVAAAVVGLVDDIYSVRGKGVPGGGLRVRHRLLIYTLIAIAGAYWFYVKLGWDILHIPFLGNYQIGWWYIPIFIFIIVSTSFSVNEADGLDGLAGGILLAAFSAYGAIAFAQGRVNLAAFCGVIVGALLAFLWFNITPARFFMGDTGSMALGTTLGIVAMLTNQALLLPVIGFLLVVEALSVMLQLTSKKLFGRKIFLSSPIHHHFEAMGWPEPKIVMRFWIISAMTAVVGMTLVLIDRFN